MSISDKKSYFKTLLTFKADYGPATFTEYVSERTGLRAVVVDQKGPKVQGYFALATEIHDDSGAPHTLEHLVFMGSRSYKYKGFLDKLATRAYSNTNAWTATDHTAYTLDTAGWEGFAQILPVYLEHVLLPTLTDSGCYTEVHHVDGNGHDAGVVYSEMQGVQNTQEELMELKAKRLIYPDEVGFRYETGGMMENLRVLTADRIRKFHRDMYQPRNLCVVIIGEVDHDNLLSTLDTFESSILDDIPSPDSPFKRPWVESKQAPAISKSLTETVEFPEEDESMGEILIGFLGPSCNDVLQTSALHTLLVYLAGSSISLLENTLVENEQVASAVYYNTEERPSTVIWFQLASVATEKLREVEQRFFEVLKEAASKPLDMQYMLECVRRQRRAMKFYAESSGSFYSDSIISDFLFGDRDGSTLKDLGTLAEYDMLEKWDSHEWRNFLGKWLADANHISILGVPSAKLSKKLKSEEKKRVEEQKSKLGKEGLERLRKRLEEAKGENDKEIPPEMLQKFKIPGTDSIHFIPTTTARSGLARNLGPLDNSVQKVVDHDKSNLPLFIQFEHVPSNFVHLSIIVSTEGIPMHLKPLLPVFLDNFFNTPINRNGERVEFEKVVTELERDTVGYSIDGGGSIGFPGALRILFQIEASKYETAIRWLKSVMWDSIFDVVRVNAAVTKLLADIPQEKRSGDSMATQIDSLLHFSRESSVRARNTLVKAVYLKRIKKLLANDPSTVLADLETLRSSLFRFSNIRILVIADVERLSRPASTFDLLTPHLDASDPLLPIEQASVRLSDAGKNPGGYSYIVPLPTIDSSFSVHTAKGPNSYTHPQLPALMVALAYLDAVEGPMWGAVRGTGLAYGTNFSRATVDGLLRFHVYRSPDASKAYMTAGKVVEDFLSGATPFEGPALEGAISSIVVQFANEQPTMASAATVSFVNSVVREVSSDYNEVMLRKVRTIGVDEIKNVLREVVLPVFMPETSNVVMTCAPILEESIKKNLEEAGFKPEVKQLSFFQDDYGLKAPDGEDNDADENDEDEEYEDEDGSGEEDEEDEEDDDADDKS